jgi:hypothetical protein
VVFAEYPLADRRGGDRSWGKISAAARFALGRRRQLCLDAALSSSLAGRGGEGRRGGGLLWCSSGGGDVPCAVRTRAFLAVGLLLRRSLLLCLPPPARG